MNDRDAPPLRRLAATTFGGAILGAIAFAVLFGTQQGGEGVVVWAMVGAVWGPQVIPAASGPQQLIRLLDALARLPDGPGPALSKLLSSPACRSPRDGLQVIVTTDLALAGKERPCPRDDQQRWVVLRACLLASGCWPFRPSVLWLRRGGSPRQRLWPLQAEPLVA